MWSNQLEQMRRNIRQWDMHSLYLIDLSPYKYRMCFDSPTCTVGIYHLYMVCNSMWWNQREQMRRNNHQQDMNSLYLIVLSLYKYRICFDSLACTVDIYRLYRVCNSRLWNQPKQKRHRIHQPDKRSSFLIDLSPYKYRMYFGSPTCTTGICHLCTVCNSMWSNQLEQMRRNNHQPDMHSLYLIVLSPYNYRMCFDSLACTVGIYRLYRVCNSRLSNQPKQMRHRIHQPDKRSPFLIDLSPYKYRNYFRLCSYIKGICHLYRVCNSMWSNQREQMRRNNHQPDMHSLFLI